MKSRKAKSDLDCSVIDRSDYDGIKHKCYHKRKYHHKGKRDYKHGTVESRIAEVVDDGQQYDATIRSGIP